MKLIALILALVTTSVFAAETVRIIEDTVPHTRHYTRATAKFHMDKESSLGYAKISVDEEYPVTVWERECVTHNDPRRPGTICRDVPRTRYEFRNVYFHTELIPNLVLEGDKIVFNGDNGIVDCGKMGLSRVFRIPTLYLNGKCNLNARLLTDRLDRKIVVDFQAK